MSSFLSKAASNPHVQLAATAVLSGATVACLIFGYQAFEREERIHDLKKSIPASSDSQHGNPQLTQYGGASPPLDKEDARNQALALRAQAGDFDEELILEQLARNRVFLKDDGLQKLRNSFVIVVGCGGVGSHCTTALARSGVSKIRLIDFDQVTLSSLNRHAVATLADVGIPKVQCLYRRLIAITPWTKFELKNQKFEQHVAEQLLAPWNGNGQKPDYVVDAIDNIDTKVALLKYCHDNKIPVISSMGAGAKGDPTRIHVADIGASTDDGLSRATRRKLKLLGVTGGIPVVYSDERATEGKAALLPLSEEEFKKGTVGDLGVLPSFRVRILPVLGTMPALFGYVVANHVICSISGYPIEYLPAKNRDKLYGDIVAYVQASETRLVQHMDGNEESKGLKVPVTLGDAAYLLEELWKGRSAITGLTNRPVLVRWKRPEGKIKLQIGEQKWTDIRFRNLVCMTRDEAMRHEKEYLRGQASLEEMYDEKVIAEIEAKLVEAIEVEKQRM
ncbi:putative ThiF domain protein [Colletotrichum sojae]|uniref:Putative ThiF domain protein n=1 Tax=Colletotrichum sojae TaxID=2175907 RepID=A0A8H6JG36_9PEZI|nr:putative ThiF domain protein [Colletotrichum sojae]